MGFRRPRLTTRIVLASITFGSLAAGALAYGCTTPENPQPASGGDASFPSGCGTLEVCSDAVAPAHDAPSVDAPSAGEDSSPGKDTGSTETDSGSDANVADANDAALAPDVDQNCADYAASASTSPTSIRVINHRDSGVYVGPPAHRCSGLNFTVNDSADASLTVSQAEYTCNVFQSACLTPIGCQPEVIVKVAPGATWEMPWTGTYFKSEPMPLHCYVDGGAACGQPTCLQELSAVGPQTVGATVYSIPLCGDASAPIPCTQDCTPGAGGTCTVPNAVLTGGTATPLSAPWSADASTIQVVQLVVQ